jgi:hypothetical protein
MTAATGFCCNYLNGKEEKCNIPCPRKHEVPKDYVCKKCSCVGSHPTGFCDSDKILWPMSLCMRPEKGECDWCYTIPATIIESSYNIGWHYCKDCKGKFLSSVKEWMKTSGPPIFMPCTPVSFMRKRTGVITSSTEVAPNTYILNEQISICVAFDNDDKILRKGVSLRNIFQNTPELSCRIAILIKANHSDFLTIIRYTTSNCPRVFFDPELTEADFAPFRNRIMNAYYDSIGDHIISE